MRVSLLSLPSHDLTDRRTDSNSRRSLFNRSAPAAVEKDHAGSPPVSPHRRCNSCGKTEICAGIRDLPQGFPRIDSLCGRQTRQQKFPRPRPDSVRNAVFRRGGIYKKSGPSRPRDCQSGSPAAALRPRHSRHCHQFRLRQCRHRQTRH